MKKFIFFSMLALGLNSTAQLTFEHTYDSAATYNICSGNVNQLMIVNFENSGERYVRINRCGKSMSIYDLNHALVKNISLASLPLENTDIVGAIVYLSENLFDTDAGIEYMYVADTGAGKFTWIYNEDGSILFFEKGAPLISPTWHNQQYPIYNTASGTKLILSYLNGQAKVFGLPGTLTTAMKQIDDDQPHSSGFISNPYPNPMSTGCRVNYELPAGINQGEMVFSDLKGMEVKRFGVDRTFDHLLISTADLAAGTYYYQLQTSAQTTEGKKMVIVK
jgi:hypothetical protein